MANDEKYRELLKKVLVDLKDFLPYLVLVGGWVPFLYSQYVWKTHHKPITTVDIDFGFQDIPYKGKMTIASRVRQQNYGEHHVEMGRLVPFVPVARLGKGDIKADIEFITSPKTSEKMKRKLIGEEIKINTIEDFEILLQDPVFIKVGALKVQVPNTAIFTLHKLLTFVERDRVEKRLKDLYYAYFMLRFCPDKTKIINEIKNLIKERKEGKKTFNNIKAFFGHKDDKGPVFIEKENGMDYFVRNVRMDAYDRITQLL